MWLWEPSMKPIFNIYSESPFSDVPEMYTYRWNLVHQELATNRPNVLNIVAHGSSHYIFRDNPGLIISAIVKAFLHTVDKTRQNDILNKALDNSTELFIEYVKNRN